MDSIISSVHHRVENRILSGKLVINHINTLRVVISTMEELEEYRNLKGEEKKKVVIAVCNKIFIQYLNTGMNEEELSETIEAIIEVSKGVYMINNKLKKMKRLCCKK